MKNVSVKDLVKFQRSPSDEPARLTQEEKTSKIKETSDN